MTSPVPRKYSDWAVERWLVTLGVTLFGCVFCTGSVLYGYLTGNDRPILIAVITMGVWLFVVACRLVVIHYKNKKILAREEKMNEESK